MHDRQSVECLIDLLGARRTDPRIESLICESEPPPEITVDKGDDADDEFVEFKAHGFGLAFDHDILQSIHLHSGLQDDGYTRYELPLPMGVAFTRSKSDLLSCLPEPDVVGGGCNDVCFGPVPEWIRYDKQGEYSVHFEFTPDVQAVVMVTLMQLPER